MSVAGLIRFYEETEVGIKLSPLTLIIIATITIALVLILRAIF